MRIGRTIPPAAAPIYFRDIINGFKGLLNGNQEIKRFEHELSDYFNVKNIFLVSSGKCALTLILEALHDLQPERNEVLIPAYICFSVPSAIVRAGLKVILCDVDPDTLTFNLYHLRRIIKERSEQLLAIVPAHLFGLPVNMDDIKNIIRDPSITIVEDAAQTMGADYKGRYFGTIGDVGFFSLGRGKALSTIEGGVILTNRGDIAKKLKSAYDTLATYNSLRLIALIAKSFLLWVFSRPNFFWLPKSLPFLRVGDTLYDRNFKKLILSCYQAGTAKNWKDKLHRFSKIRQKNSQLWFHLLKSFKFKLYSANSDPFYLRFPVRVDDKEIKDELLKVSNNDGLGIMFTYPTSINLIPELRTDFAERQFANAEQMAEKIVTFPVHPFVKERDIANIMKSLNSKLIIKSFCPN